MAEIEIPNQVQLAQSVAMLSQRNIVLTEQRRVMLAALKHVREFFTEYTANLPECMESRLKLRAAEEMMGPIDAAIKKAEAR